MNTQEHTSPLTLEGLQRQLLELKISNLEEGVADHEKRIRLLEESATKFNFLLYLTLGNGFISVIALIKLFIP
jgi:hypothetical protein